MVIFALVFLCVKESSAQNTPPEFPNCDKTVITLCTDDPGVILPPSNKIYLGETDPLATSCSVHLSQSETGIIDCGTQIFYEVDLFLFDNSDPIKLLNSTLASVDENGEVELSFNSSMSPDSILAYNGIPYNDICGPAHRVRWTVTDSCGQVAVCERYIHLYDCFQDSLELGLPSVIVLKFCNPVKNIHAKDYVFPMDDCLLHDEYLVSYSEEEYIPDSLFDACVEGFAIAVPVEMWLSDGGADLNCNGTIEWVERNKRSITKEFVFIEDGGCIDCYWPECTLGGRVTTSYGAGINGVTVRLSSTSGFFASTITDLNGDYIFNALPVGIDLEISLEKNDDHKNGVSTIDLVHVLKGLLGVVPIVDPYALIAVDANNNYHLNAIDIVILRKLVLNILQEFPDNTSWRFVPADYVFPDPLNPFGFPEGTTITTTSESISLDFIGIKIGDLNHTARTD